MTLEMGTSPVRSRRWKWLDIKAHAKQRVWLSRRIPPSRFRKLSRSLSSLKIFRRSIPRTMMWCNAPGAS